MGRFPHPRPGPSLIAGGARGDEYDRRFLERERAGQDVHGEANFVASYAPRTALDAGCGTGRVAIELARRGVRVVGVDVDPVMLATARRKAPNLEWVEGDLATTELRGAGGGCRRFDVAVLAGNVMIFVAPGTEGDVLANVARLCEPGGRLISGFQLARGGLTADRYDQLAVAAGLELSERWSGWAREPWASGGDYMVSVHRR